MKDFTTTQDSRRTFTSTNVYNKLLCKMAKASSWQCPMLASQLQDSVVQSTDSDCS